MEKANISKKILVATHSLSKYVGANVVSAKGIGENRCAVETMRRDILWLGYSRIILKSDNEPAIVSLLTEVLKGLKVNVVDAAPGHPPPYDSQASGHAENAAKQVQELLGCLKNCPGTGIQYHIPCEHPIMASMVQQAAWILAVRSEAQMDARRTSGYAGARFPRRLSVWGNLRAEAPQRQHIQTRCAKARRQMVPRSVLGYDTHSNEYICHSRERLVKSRTLQKVPMEKRWSRDAMQEVRAPPHSVYARPDANTVFIKDPSVAVEAKYDAQRHKVRDMKLGKKYFGDHGYTADGCDRCDWAVRFRWEAKTTKSHSKGCEQRMRKATMDSGEKGKARVNASGVRRGRAKEVFNDAEDALFNDEG